MFEKRRFISNSLAMVINRVAQSIATFVLSAAIARLLGTDELGQYLLAFTFYSIFIALASEGLKTLFTRELARNPEETPTYLVNGIFLQLLFSLVAYIALVATVFIMPYSDKVSMVCYIMGLAVIPFALSNITEAIFQAQEKMHLIALSTVPIYLLRLLVMLVAMHFKYGIETVAAIFVISEILIFLIQWLCITRFVKPEWKIKGDFLRDTVWAVRTFFAIEGVAVISTRLNVLVLSILGSELLLGLYGGVLQLLQPFLIIANSLATAMFPSMSKVVDQGWNEQRRVTEGLIEVLMLIALPFLVGILFLGRDLLTLVYGPSFAQADLEFKISALSLLLMPFNRALSFLLVANGLEKVNLRELMVTTPISGVLGVFLIYQFQLLGAAAMLPVKMVISGSQYIFATYNRLFVLNLWKIFARPALVSLLMALLLWALKQINFAAWAVMLIGTTAYCVIVGMIGVFVLGGPRLVYTKLLSKE